MYNVFCIVTGITVPVCIIKMLMRTDEMNNEVIMPFEVEKEYFVDPVEVKKKPVYSFFKRFFDIIVSVLAMIILALPMLIVGIVVKCTSKGPVIYKQERLGLNGKKIVVYKTNEALHRRGGS